MKPFWMSWKTYAKNLETKLAKRNEENKARCYYDSFIKETLCFPSIESLVDYLEKKSGYNIEMACRVWTDGESITPSVFNYEKLRTMEYLSKYRKMLTDQAKSSRAIFKYMSEGRYEEE